MRISFLLPVTACAALAAPLDIGTRLEPFMDDYLIAEMHDVALTAGVPERESVALRFDEPWEGYFASFMTIIKDGPKYRLYYRGWSPGKPEVTCYAESNDGREFIKPKLGIHAYEGRTDTNIILSGMPNISSDFSPFLDNNPEARPEERFKAVGGTRKGGGLYTLASADGIKWQLLHPEPVFSQGAFDSQNVAFWSALEKQYVLYFRVTSEGSADSAFRGFRTISRTTSKDMIHWTPPQRMTFGDAPDEHLYTQQTHPYFRAPHIYLAFPMRFVPGRQFLSTERARELGVYKDREKNASDTVFMTSRGGNTYQRTFRSAYFRPGPDPMMWVGRNSIVALGVVPLDGGRMGLYRQHRYASLDNHLVLYSVRQDGFASLRAGGRKGFIVTKPFQQAGRSLWLNFATSAIGGVEVEVLDENGRPLPDYAGANASRFFGDSLAQEVVWSGSGATWAGLAGKNVRLKIGLQDADLYSLQQR